MPEFDTVILSAGFSSRMHGFKPLYRIGPSTALAKLVDTFRTAGIRETLVVHGHNGKAVEREAEAFGARPVQNPEYRQGMFSSVRAGVEALKPGAAGFFVLPVDIPLVRPQTIRLLMERFREHPGDVLHPCFMGERGHPPLLNHELRATLSSWNGDYGLRGFLEHIEKVRPGKTDTLPVADQGILSDMDTEEDYARLNRRRPDIPTPAECTAALHIIGTPERTIRHGKAVAAVASALGRAVNRRRKNGPMLDLQRIESAALLHDIAKGVRNHEQAGARMLDDMGFTGISAIVAVHRDIPPEPDRIPDEADTVFMADKVTAGTEIVPVAERYGRVLERHGHIPEARAAIEGRLSNALAMELKFEEATGSGLVEQAGEALQAAGIVHDRPAEIRPAEIRPDKKEEHTDAR